MIKANNFTYENIADEYDTWVQISTEETDATVEALETMGRGGSLLELGIGTGRVAIPLAARGLAVQGVDYSPKMVEQLRKKPGGAQIPVLISDFTKIARGKGFFLVYVVFNTFFELLTQEAQVECFRSVAGCLQPNGIFVIEALVPDVGAFVNNQSVNIRASSSDECRLEIGTHDCARQRISSEHYVISREHVRIFQTQLRYSWPSELDLMGVVAGMCLRHRWGNWSGAPFTNSSQRHVSIYVRRNN